MSECTNATEDPLRTGPIEGPELAAIQEEIATLVRKSYEAHGAYVSAAPTGATAFDRQWEVAHRLRDFQKETLQTLSSAIERVSALFGPVVEDLRRQVKALETAIVTQTEAGNGMLREINRCKDHIWKDKKIYSTLPAEEQPTAMGLTRLYETTFAPYNEDQYKDMILRLPLQARAAFLRIVALHGDFKSSVGCIGCNGGKIDGVRYANMAQGLLRQAPEAVAISFLEKYERKFRSDIGNSPYIKDPQDRYFAFMSCETEHAFLQLLLEAWSEHESRAAGASAEDTVQA